MILKEWQKEKEEGGSTMFFSYFTGIARSLLYLWKKKQEEDSLENKPTVAKNHPMKVSKEKRAEIIKIYEKKKEEKKPYGERALGYLTQVSGSLVGKILRAYRGKIRGNTHPAQNFYQFKHIHLCWSADLMMIKVKESWARILILLEEFSRYILGYKIAYKITAEEVENLLLWAIEFYSIKPLLFKHDRGSQFMAKRIQDLLPRLNIIDLATPVHYPYSNGKTERKQKELREWFKVYEGKVSIEELNPIAKERIMEINWLYPRGIFDGATSGKVLTKGIFLEEKSKEEFRLMLKEKEERLISHGKSFQKARWEAVQKSLLELDLVSFREKPVLPFQKSFNKGSFMDFSGGDNIWIPLEKDPKEVLPIEQKNDRKEKLKVIKSKWSEGGKSVY